MNQDKSLGAKEDFLKKKTTGVWAFAKWVDHTEVEDCE